ncbi:hypothetical protein IVB14_00960 [Bradyrhizobium sp. 180]|uniref:hypothetical protein n=1 Tax=Bradyrhizobium sp. 180 TaxID=2782650 RepID=UPI001FFB9FA4|nr:hypothetical protein [Bradyrhizobium sp. 180]MCK1489050.1 hypothetical protein [Bradyrhizobium sp. 180]
MEVYTREGLKIDLGTFEGNTAFEADKPAIHFEGAPLKLTLLRRMRAGGTWFKGPGRPLHEQLIRILSAEGLQIKCDN